MQVLFDRPEPEISAPCECCGERTELYSGNVCDEDGDHVAGFAVTFDRSEATTVLLSLRRNVFTAQVRVRRGELLLGFKNAADDSIDGAHCLTRSEALVHPQRTRAAELIFCIAEHPAIA